MNVALGNFQHQTPSHTLIAASSTCRTIDRPNANVACMHRFSKRDQQRNHVPMGRKTTRTSSLVYRLV